MLFYLHYKNRNYTPKNNYYTLRIQKSTIFAIEIKTEQCGGT